MPPKISGTRAEATTMGRPAAPTAKGTGGSAFPGTRASSAPGGGQDKGQAEATGASLDIEDVRKQSPQTDRRPGGKKAYPGPKQ